MRYNCLPVISKYKFFDFWYCPHDIILFYCNILLVQCLLLWQFPRCNCTLHIPMPNIKKKVYTIWPNYNSIKSKTLFGCLIYKLFKCHFMVVFWDSTFKNQMKTSTLFAVNKIVVLWNYVHSVYLLYCLIVIARTIKTGFLRIAYYYIQSVFLSNYTTILIW